MTQKGIHKSGMVKRDNYGKRYRATVKEEDNTRGGRRANNTRWRTCVWRTSV